MSVFGLDLTPLDDGEIPLEAICVVKILDAKGDTQLAVRATGGVSVWERAGMLRAAQVIVDDDMRCGYVPRRRDDGEDDDEQDRF